MKNIFSSIVYANNEDPKIGDKVRSSRDIFDGVDVLYTVETVGLGRLGNKVYVRSAGEQYGRELYYYCLCPQYGA